MTKNEVKGVREQLSIRIGLVVSTQLQAGGSCACSINPANSGYGGTYRCEDGKGNLAYVSLMQDAVSWLNAHC